MNDQLDVRLLQGDSLEVLKQLPSGSVHMCCTSPPYFGLRNYGVAGQIGLEKTPAEYVARLVEVFREVRRVMRDDGTLWLNLGDSYAGGGGGNYSKGTRNNSGQNVTNVRNRPAWLDEAALKPKDLIGVPWMVAFALRADGWYLRSDIIWAKPNCMPEAVKDRPTKSHEYLFLLSKSARYFYDAEAIKGPVSDKTLGVNTTPIKGTGEESTGEKVNAWMAANGGRYHPSTVNKRSVWEVSSRPYAGAHFAVMPEALVEPCVLAGTSARGCCPHCLAPWRRVTERTRKATRPGLNTKCLPKSDRDTATADAMGWNRPQVIGNRDPQRHCTETLTTGWAQGCKCPDAPPAPAVVLDPFVGSGTVCAVALRNDRCAVGIDLSPKYLELARQRCEAVTGGLFGPPSGLKDDPEVPG